MVIKRIQSRSDFLKYCGFRAGTPSKVALMPKERALCVQKQSEGITDQKLGAIKSLFTVRLCSASLIRLSYFGDNICLHEIIMLCGLKS